MSNQFIEVSWITKSNTDLAALRATDVTGSKRSPSVPATQNLLSKLVSNGAMYYYDTTSTAADDGLLVVKPDQIDPGNPGRWLLNSVINSSSSATDERVPRFDGTSGKVLQPSSLRVTDTGLVIADNSISGKGVMEIEDSAGPTHTVRMYVDSGSFYETIQFGTVAGGKADWMELYADGSINYIDTKADNFKIRSTAQDNILLVNQASGLATFGYDATATGTLTGSTITDGTASLNSGAWTGITTASMSGALTSTLTSGNAINIAITGGQIVSIGGGQGNALNFDGSRGQFITSTASAAIIIDSSNDDTARYFALQHNSNDMGTATDLLRVNEDGSAVFAGELTGITNLTATATIQGLTLKTEGTITANGNNFTCGSYIAPVSAPYFRFNSSDSGTSNYQDINCENSNRVIWSSLGGVTQITDAVGIGAVTAPVRKVEIVDTSDQLRLTHTLATHYCDFKTDSASRLNIVSSGGLYRIASSDSGSTQYFDINSQNSSHVSFSSKEGPLFFNSNIQYSSATQTLSANGQTIPTNVTVMEVNAGTGYTGIILAAGTRHWQIVKVRNTTGGVGHIAFDGTPATSNVSTPASADVEPGNIACFYWDTGDSLWHRYSYNAFL